MISCQPLLPCCGPPQLKYMKNSMITQSGTNMMWSTGAPDSGVQHGCQCLLSPADAAGFRIDDTESPRLKWVTALPKLWRVIKDVLTHTELVIGKRPFKWKQRAIFHKRSTGPPLWPPLSAVHVLQHIPVSHGRSAELTASWWARGHEGSDCRSVVDVESMSPALPTSSHIACFTLATMSQHTADRTCQKIIWIIGAVSSMH